MNNSPVKRILLILSSICILAVLVAAFYSLGHRQEVPVSTIQDVNYTSGAFDSAASLSKIKDGINIFSLDTFSVDNGLSTGEANAVLQTDDGFIWVGSYGGLLRFDGRSFTQMSGENNGMSSHSIRSLWQSSDGTLWIGSNEQGPFYKTERGFSQPELNTSGTHLSVRCFAEDAFGRVWFGSSGGLAYIENDSVHIFDFEDYGYSNSIIYTLSADSRGILWAVDYSGSLIAVDPAEMCISEIISPGDIWDKNLYAYSALVCGDELYVGTNTSVILVISLSAEHSVRSVSSGGLSGINSICRSGSELWFCGDTGLGLISDGSYHDLSYLDNTSHLGCISPDYEGSIWISSTKSGLLHVKRNKFETYINSPLPESSEVYSICRTGSSYYVGSEKGLLVLDENRSPVYSPLCEVLDGIQVHHIIQASDGRIYIGTYYNGLFIVDPDDSSYDVVKVGGNRIRSILELHDGRIAVMSDSGLDIVENCTVTESYSQFGSAPQLLCGLELPDGTILCGSDGSGIFAVKDGAVSVYGSTDNGLSGGIILRMAIDSRDPDMIWVSCGYDLFYGNASGFSPAANPTQGVGSIVDIFPQDDNIWLFRSNGILRMNRDELLDRQQTQPSELFLGISDGLPGTIIANSWSYFDSRLFIICTSNGLCFLDVPEMYINHTVPLAAVNDIGFGDGSAWDGSTDLRLSPDNNRLSISMAALSFSGKGAAIEYQMTGIDPRPLIRGTSEPGSVEYTNIAPGSYTFTLRAINSDGMKGQPISVSFERLPRFTETVWFPVLLIALSSSVVCIAFLIANYLRIKRLREKEQMYRALTEQSILTISGAIDAKDPYTQGHSQRVADFSVKLAHRMGLSEDDCERLYYIALLHDIGKIGIPDEILKKPSRLTDEEFSVIRQHPRIGSEILKDFTALEGVGEGAKYHHERYDGKGYNEGLKGEEIPLFARIIGVADAYDAMHSTRCYRPKLSTDYILSELENGRGSQFDPQIAELAIAIICEEEKRNA